MVWRHISRVYLHDHITCIHIHDHGCYPIPLLYTLHLDLLYWAAITKAMEEIFNQKSKNAIDYDNSTWRQNTREVTCLVFGAGLGRLVQYCVDAAQAMQCATSINSQPAVVATKPGSTSGTQLITAHVHAVDANPLAVDCLCQLFQDHHDNDQPQSFIEVLVHPPFTLFPGMQKEDIPEGLRDIYHECDLVVSELLGCFGCDEFLPELTSTLSRLFLNSDGICIPKDWTTYIAPIQSSSLHNALANKPSSTYTVGIPRDCIFMCEPRALWKGSCQYYQTPCNHGIEFEFSPFMLNECQNSKQFDFQPHPLNQFIVHGLVGYFTSCLYDDIIIDTRHTGSRNSYHWECFYMPLSKPITIQLQELVNKDFSLLANVQRTCSIIKNSSCGSIWSPQAGLCKGTSLLLTYSWSLKLFIKADGGKLKLNQQLSEIGNAISIMY